MLRLRNKLPTNQRGAVLLLSLMLLTLVMFSTLSLATILVTELRSARFSDNSIIAHYAAESGSERALFLLKEARSVDELADAQPYDQFFNLSGTDGRVDASPSLDLEREYTFSDVRVTSDSFTANNIPLNTSVQLDIFDPTKEQDPSPDTGVKNISINWEVNQASQTNNQLEVTILSYVSNGTSIEIEKISGKSNPRKEYYPCIIISGTNCTERGLVLDYDRFYHLTFRPIDGDVKKVSVSASDINGDATGIPSQIFIKTTGRYRDASQEVTVQTPWDNGTSDIFNYVIFSDSSLIKNILNTSVEAFPSLCGSCVDNPIIGCSTAADCVAVGGNCMLNNPTKAACDLDDDGNTGEIIAPSDNINQNNFGLCNSRCSGYTYCGDGTLQNPNGAGVGGPAIVGPPPLPNGNGSEQCDDGNISNTDECTTSCVNTRCGDGLINRPNAAGFTEVCDETVVCGAAPNIPPKCKSNTVVGACKTDCSGYVTSGPPPPCRDCPPIDS